MAQQQMEKHQYNFSIMNFRTGKSRCKTFWGIGKDENECRIEARKQAKAYASKLTDEAYNKACLKEKSNYLPSRSSYEFDVVGCTLMK